MIGIFSDFRVDGLIGLRGARSKRSAYHHQDGGQPRTGSSDNAGTPAVARRWMRASKSFAEDNETGKLDEAKEVPGVVLPTDQDAALPLYPGEEALDQSAPHVAG